MRGAQGAGEARLGKRAQGRRAGRRVRRARRPTPPPGEGARPRRRGRTRAAAGRGRARLTHARGGPSFHEAGAELDPACTCGEARQNRPRRGPPRRRPPPSPAGLTSALRVDGGLHRVHAHLHEEAIVHTWRGAAPSARPAPWLPTGSAPPPAAAPPPPRFRRRPRPPAPASGLAPSRPGPAPPVGARAGAGGWRRRRGGAGRPARLARALRR